MRFLKNKNLAIFPSRYGFFPYMYLLYLLFPIYYLTLENGWKQWIGFGMLGLFLLTYRQLYFTFKKHSYTMWLSIQLLIVFIFSLFYHYNYLFLGFFPANFIGWYRDNKKFYIGLFGLILVELIPSFYYLLSDRFPISTPEMFYLVPFIIIMFLSPFGIRSMNKRMDLEKQLDQANEQIKELVKREERIRIARDLHDTLGHTLSLLTLKSQLVQRLTSVDPEKARHEAKQMEITSRAALKQVRELVTVMRAATIKEELLDMQHILKAAEISYQFEGKDDKIISLSPFSENIVCMCLREAATNVVKHSKAKICYVSLEHESDHLTIIIKDDGMGMAGGHPFGNGLNGMKERLDLIDGTVSIFNQNGTVVKITVPIIKTAEKEGAAV